MIMFPQRQKLLAILAVAVFLIQPVTVFAQSSSTNYKIEETFFGTGGDVDSSSTNYRSQQSAGSLGVGNTSSTNYDAVGGNITPNAPFLEMSIQGPNLDLGTLNPATTSYISSQGGACSCTFYVRTYLSSQYSVITASNPPTNESGAVFSGKATQGAPSGSTSVEEFGINLVANTSPATFGSNPSNDPDNTFADGQAATGYQTTNQYKYVAGDIIARSQATAGNQAVGRTNYTISYIMKPSNISRAGTYIMRHDLIAVPIY